MWKFFRFTICLFLLTFLQPFSVAAEERILSMDVLATVRTDGTVAFRETLWVRVENVKINRGIVRVFPTDYKNTEGRWVGTKFKLISASIHHRPTMTKIERVGRNLEIRIGDPNVILSKGDHVFELTYETVGWIAFRDEFDELYWNVTGNDWEFPIDKAGFSLILPEGASVTKRVVFTGRRGERGENYAVKPDGRVLTRTPLALGEGLTVAFAWPKGFVTPPPLSTWEWINKHRSPLAIVMTIVVSLYFSLVWYWKGRDPAKGVVIPLFRPPDGVSPGFARYLREMRYSKEILTADILQLAAKGCLRFAEEGGIIRILPTGKRDATEGFVALDEPLLSLAMILGLIPESDESTPLAAAQYLQKILSGFAKRMGASNISMKSSTIGGKTHARFEAKRPGSTDAGGGSPRNGISVTKGNGSIFCEAEGWLQEHYKSRAKQYFRTNIAWNIIGMFLLLPLFALAFRPIAHIPFITDIFGVAFGLALIVVFLVGRSFKRIVVPSVIGAFFLLVPGVLFGTDKIGAACLAVALLIALFFSRVMRVYTPEGRKILTAIEGLEMYMKTAERDRLAALNPPDRTPEHFEALLPYAFALGCAETWADNFSDVLAKASLDPAWRERSGTYHAHFMNDLSRNLDSSVSHYKSSLSSSSSSSSFGGDSGFSSSGSSGGGGGGGGGRGW